MTRAIEVTKQTYVRREHGGGNLATVMAVAYVGVHEVLAFNGLRCVRSCLILSCMKRPMEGIEAMAQKGRTTSSCTVPQ